MQNCKIILEPKTQNKRLKRKEKKKKITKMHTATPNQINKRRKIHGKFFFSKKKRKKYPFHEQNTFRIRSTVDHFLGKPKIKCQNKKDTKMPKDTSIQILIASIGHLERCFDNRSQRSLSLKNLQSEAAMKLIK